MAADEFISFEGHKLGEIAPDEPRIRDTEDLGRGPVGEQEGLALGHQADPLAESFHHAPEVFLALAERDLRPPPLGDLGLQLPGALSDAVLEGRPGIGQGVHHGVESRGHLPGFIQARNRGPQGQVAQGDLAGGLGHDAERLGDDHAEKINGGQARDEQAQSDQGEIVAVNRRLPQGLLKG